MAQLVFSHTNDWSDEDLSPYHGVERGAGTPLGGLCVGYSIEWAKSALNGQEARPPAMHQAKNATVAARSHLQILEDNNPSAVVPYDKIEGALLLTQTAPTLKVNAHSAEQLFDYIANDARADVYMAAFFSATNGHAIGVKKNPDDTFYCFDPDKGCHKCLTPQDFLDHTRPMAEACPERGVVFNIRHQRNLGIGAQAEEIDLAAPQLQQLQAQQPALPHAPSPAFMPQPQIRQPAMTQAPLPAFMPQPQVQQPAVPQAPLPAFMQQGQHRVDLNGRMNSEPSQPIRARRRVDTASRPQTAPSTPSKGTRARR